MMRVEAYSLLERVRQPSRFRVGSFMNTHTQALGLYLVPRLRFTGNP